MVASTQLFFVRIRLTNRMPSCTQFIFWVRSRSTKLFCGYAEIYCVLWISIDSPVLVQSRSPTSIKFTRATFGSFNYKRLGKQYRFYFTLVCLRVNPTCPSLTGADRFVSFSSFQHKRCLWRSEPEVNKPLNKTLILL